MQGCAQFVGDATVRVTCANLSKVSKREMKFDPHFDINKLFALSARVIRRLSTAESIITPRAKAYIRKSCCMLFDIRKSRTHR